MQKRFLDTIFLVNKEGDLTCFTDLTEKERIEYIKNCPPEIAKEYLLELAKCLKAIGDKFDIESIYANGKRMGWIAKKIR